MLCVTLVFLFEVNFSSLLTCLILAKRKKDKAFFSNWLHYVNFELG